jgi:hypothetical protein
VGAQRNAPQVKLFTGVITSMPQILDALQARLEVELGPVDLRSPGFPFDSTDYYTREMGAPLVRVFWGFERLAAADRIAAIKRFANEVEAGMARLGLGVQRPANIDPGYLEESKVVLVSTKNFYHRILVGEGIYAEVTMHWRERRWHPFPWTFPDFRTGRYDGFFAELRALYREQIGRRGRSGRADRGMK